MKNKISLLFLLLISLMLSASSCDITINQRQPQDKYKHKKTPIVVDAWVNRTNKHMASIGGCVSTDAIIAVYKNGQYCFGINLDHTKRFLFQISLDRGYNKIQIKAYRRSDKSLESWASLVIYNRAGRWE